MSASFIFIDWRSANIASVRKVLSLRGNVSVVTNVFCLGSPVYPRKKPSLVELLFFAP